MTYNIEQGHDGQGKPTPWRQAIVMGQESDDWLRELRSLVSYDCDTEQQW